MCVCGSSELSPRPPAASNPTDAQLEIGCAADLFSGPNKSAFGRRIKISLPSAIKPNQFHHTRILKHQKTNFKKELTNANWKLNAKSFSPVFLWAASLIILKLAWSAEGFDILFPPSGINKGEPIANLQHARDSIVAYYYSIKFNKAAPPEEKMHFTLALSSSGARLNINLPLDKQTETTS